MHRGCRYGCCCRGGTAGTGRSGRGRGACASGTRPPPHTEQQQYVDALEKAHDAVEKFGNDGGEDVEDVEDVEGAGGWMHGASVGGPSLSQMIANDNEVTDGGIPGTLCAVRF